MQKMNEKNKRDIFNEVAFNNIYFKGFSKVGFLMGK